MQGGSCAELGSQGCTCSSSIYTHKQFTTSGQSFLPWVGRFGLQRDISTRVSGKYGKALYVRADLLSASAQLWGFHPLGSERSLCHELCSECPVSQSCPQSCRGDAEGGTGAVELPQPCSCAKARLGSLYLASQPWGSEHPFGNAATFLSWRGWSWPCPECSWWICSAGKAPGPAASDGPWPPTGTWACRAPPWPWK